MLKELLIHLTLFLGSKQDHDHTFFRLFFLLVIVRECFQRLSGNPKSFFWSPPPFKGRHSPPVESRILIPSPTYQLNRSLPATRKTNKLRTRATRGRPDHPASVPVSVADPFPHPSARTVLPIRVSSPPAVRPDGPRPISHSQPPPQLSAFIFPLPPRWPPPPFC